MNWVLVGGHPRSNSNVNTARVWCLDAKSLPRLKSEYTKQSSFPGLRNHSENATTSIRTVEREQIRNNCSLYGEKHSPGGPTQVLITKILFAPYCAIERNECSLPWQSIPGFVAWKTSGHLHSPNIPRSKCNSKIIGKWYHHKKFLFSILNRHH